MNQNKECKETEIERESDTEKRKSYINGKGRETHWILGQFAPYFNTQLFSGNLLYSSDHRRPMSSRMFNNKSVSGMVMLQ